IGKLREGDTSCLPSFVIITLIQRTVQRSTAGYARNSYQSLRLRRGLCVTIGLIPATARARPPACLRTVGADESVRLAADYIKEHLSKLLIQKSEIIEGPIKAHELSTDTTLRSSDGLRRPTIWSADAHRGDGKRLVARADEELAAFIETRSSVRSRLHWS